MNKQIAQKKLISILEILSSQTKSLHKTLIAELVDDFGKNPFIILIACLLSLRAKDTATLPVCRKLFSLVTDSRDLLEIPLDQLHELLRPLGFYRKKAAVLRRVCNELLERHQGLVPSAEAELRALHGVGLKTVNLVLAEAFDIPAICVDTHVHRIMNRLGIISTKTPEATEQALRQILPKEQWHLVNRVFVTWGQAVCVPISPFCSRCPLARGLCAQKMVKKTR